MASKKQLFTTSKSSGNSLLPWLGIAAIIILIDQITKITVEKLFEFRETKMITSFFDLTLTYNQGAAWGFLDNQPGWQRYFFITVGVVAVCFIIHLLRRHSGQRLFCWSLALIMGGAIGNVIDRIAYGKVIDFLSFHYADVYYFPVFNVADIAISLGAMLFIYDELRRVNKS